MSTATEVKNQIAKQGEIKSVFDFMQSKRDLIARALPNTITPDRLIGVFTMLLNSSPALMKCTQTSLIGAVIQTVQLGLTPGNIGHVHYIPFNNKQGDGSYKMEVQFQIGYKGLVELVNRSGKACILNAECVYKNDVFSYEQGLNPVLRHIPAQSERGELMGVYCIAKNMQANEKVFLYLNKTDIEKVKKASKAATSTFSPWNSWEEEMWKKTSVKRICKLLPLSLEIQQKISADETIKTQIDKDMVEVKDEANWESVQEAEIVKATESPVEAEQTQPELAKSPKKPTPDWSIISKDQQVNLVTIATKKKVAIDQLLMDKWGLGGVENVPKFLYEEILNHINA